MRRTPSTFKQSDLTRALRAAAAVGLKVTGYKINPQGEIEVVTGDSPAHDSAASPWDRATEELKR